MARERMQAQDRKAAIIKTAIKVIARTNFDQATTAMIAKECGVNVALIYYHFQSKQLLELAILDYIREDFINVLTSARIFAKPPRSAIQDMSRKYFQLVNLDPDMINCILKAFAVENEEIRAKAFEILQTFHDFIEEYLNAARANGLVHPEHDNDIISWSILATTILLFLFNILGQSDAIPMEKLDQASAVVEKMLKLGP